MYSNLNNIKEEFKGSLMSSMQ